MARRSPTNNRYQKGTTPKGSTRKSAASAKPKRSVGESSKSKKTAAKGAKNTNKGSWSSGLPDTPEYKKYRRLWWYSLGISFVLLTATLLLTFVPSVGNTLGLSSVVKKTMIDVFTYVAIAFVALSWYLDLKKIRPIVKRFDGKSSTKVPKPDKADKKAKKADDKAADKKDETTDDETDKADEAEEDKS